METPPRRSLVLTERRRTLCHLDGADVEFLLAHHRPHLEIQPTRERATLQLRPRGYVGVINAPHTRLTIRPKIPLKNLCYLLDVTPPVETGDDHTELTEGDCLINLLALRLAQLMAERVAAGLQRDYVERREHSPFVQGKIDVAEQMRSNPARKDRVACQFEDHTPDTFVNQLPKATAEWLIGTPFLADGVRQQLRQALTGFVAVTPLPLPRRDFAFWLALNTAIERYQPLLYLCRLLLENLNASARHGGDKSPSFLLNLERAFENFCTRQLAEFFARDDGRQRFWIFPQNAPVPHLHSDGLHSLRFCPDVMVAPLGRHQTLLVVDAKWKVSPFQRSDLYQILGYSAALGFAQGMLVYPGSRSKTWRYHFPAGDKTIHIQQLRVTGDLAACRRATERWLRKVHQLCKQALPD